MLGEKALELIHETKRARDTLGPFNEDKVRSVLEEIKVLYESNEKEIFSEQPSKAAIVLRHAALERDKRCVLAYIYHRYGHKLSSILFASAVFDGVLRPPHPVRHT